MHPAPATIAARRWVSRPAPLLPLRPWAALPAGLTVCSTWADPLRRWRERRPARFRLLAALLALALGGCGGAPDPLERVRAEGRLRVGTLAIPGTFHLDEVGASGTAHALVTAFAGHLGVAVDWTAFPSRDALLAAVAAGRVDLAAAALVPNAADAATVRFGAVLRREPVTAVYRRGTARPRVFDDLLGRQLRATPATRDMLGAAAASASLTDPVSALAAVDSGAAQSALVLEHQLLALRLVLPMLREGFAPGARRDVAWAFARRGGDSLYNASAHWVRKARASGQLQALLARSRAHLVEFDYVAMLIWQRHLYERLPAFAELFRQAAAATALDWRLLAAMAYQESHWQPDAVSPTGVRGLMMLTRDTAELMGVADRRDPVQSVAGGARYLRWLLDGLPADIAPEDRLWFALAAYNVGPGHVADARMLTRMHGRDARLWYEVEAHLPLLEERVWFERTRHGRARGSEPVRYVDNIRRFYDALRWEPLRQSLLGTRRD